MKEFTTATLREMSAWIHDHTRERSAWDRGVNEYADWMITHMMENLDQLNDDAYENSGSYAIDVCILDGAQSWTEASYGGCFLIYDHSIARMLCTPSELRRCKEGSRYPNKHETWLDVQARALFQASMRVHKAYAHIEALRASGKKEV